MSKAANKIVQGSLFALDNAKDLNSKNRIMLYRTPVNEERGPKVVISSMRDPLKGQGRKGKEDGWTGQRFSDIYVIEGERAKKNKKRGQEANANDEIKWEILNAIDMINTKDHEGVVTFDSRKDHASQSV